MNRERQLALFKAQCQAKWIKFIRNPKRFEGNLDDHHHARCLKEEVMSVENNTKMRINDRVVFMRNTEEAE